MLTSGVPKNEPWERCVKACMPNPVSKAVYGQCYCEATIIIKQP
jgi:hypothetical protein